MSNSLRLRSSEGINPTLKLDWLAAADRAHEGDRWNTVETVKFDRRLIQEALGRASDKKARAASRLGLIDTENCEAILNLEFTSANVSSIPEGIYAGSIRTDKAKLWMTNENRAWSLELNGTTPRTAIQFGYGKDFRWSDCAPLITRDGDPLVIQSMRYLGRLPGSGGHSP